MSVTAVLGCQWGDEGKGKIVDSLSKDISIVARFQGGANAGHTIYYDGHKIVLHQIPSGILQKNAACLLGHGMVIDPVGLTAELESLTRYGLAPERRIYIAPNANIITPFHKEKDRLLEAKAGNRSIGTTMKGIGPAYSERTDRQSLKAWQLFDEEAISVHLTQQYHQLKDIFGQAIQSIAAYEKQIEEFFIAVGQIKELIRDFSSLLLEAVAQEKNILIEGAQGLLLDLDYGTFPYVTSSHTGAGGIFSGLPLNFKQLDKVYGVYKAYNTRVGNGPFPTEQQGSIGEKLQQMGFEYGATTGRPRRCGWFDAVLARYAAHLNGVDEIVLTKLDVLNDFSELKVAVAYRIHGVEYGNLLGQMHHLPIAEPVYEILPGWQQSLTGINSFSELPQKARDYILFLEKVIGRPISFISTGVNREDCILR
jgi:adenylosuccinate synthase